MSKTFKPPVFNKDSVTDWKNYLDKELPSFLPSFHPHMQGK